MNLVFTTDQMPGYSRVRRGKGFSFHSPDGGLLRDKKEIQRLKALAIPPAYESVWICMLPNGHLQATGLDAQGRKQYRYHPLWHEQAADRKFDVLTSFAAALPKIRNQARRELTKPDLTHDRVISGVVMLLDSTGYRIGNRRYAWDNRSYGLSTVLMRHLKEEDGNFRLAFRGKSGLAHCTEIVGPQLIRLIAELQDLPGQHLFRYEDESGKWHDITTRDINDWLKEVSGGDFSAKQFRTWKATVLCAMELAGQPPPESAPEARKVLNQAIRKTADRLHHTPAICRKHYIHPRLLTAFRSGDLFRIMNARPPALSKRSGTASLYANERRVLKILLPRKRPPKGSPPVGTG